MAITELQEKILALVIEGKSNTEIAKALHYSKWNIKYHLDKIYSAYKIPIKNPQSRRALLIKEVTKQELTKII